MVISHNLIAENSYRQLNIVSKQKKDATEKLSSGYRINKAADDAAGLAISEKMRRQIHGLTRASENAHDGISLVQVADGALSEMHDIMQRINVLAIQSANETNSGEDREYIQQEVGQLTNEIGRISKDTTFNEIPLFVGNAIVGINSDDYSNAKFDETVNIGGQNYYHSKAMDFSKITPDNVNQLNGKSFSVICSQGCSQTFNFNFTDSGGSSVAVSGSSARPSLDVTVDISVAKTGKDIANTIYNLAASKETDIKNAAPVSGSIPGGANAVYIGHANGLALSDGKLTFFAPGNDSNGKIIASDLEAADRVLDIQVGAEKGQFIGINLYTITPSTLGLSDIDVSTTTGAANAIDTVKTGIEKLSQYRAYYGATQNRLEHTIKNLDNVVENTTSAESAIRDTDMAKQMVEFSKFNILEQAGTSMLAQANQNTQSVLSLLS